MSETQENIGKVHAADLPRDAIHIAVVQVSTNETLKPGEHIGFVHGSDSHVTTSASELIGIVDPFIEGEIPKQSSFYLWLYPNSVTGLTHNYLHPVLDKNDPRIKAKQIVMNWINTWFYPWDTKDPNDTAETMYQKAVTQFKNGEEFDFDGRWRNEDLDYDYEDENSNPVEDPRLKPVYDALEVITGKKATKEQREHYYSCCI